MRSSQLNQQRILDYIKSEIELKGYPPSVREICQAVGLKSTSTVHAHLNHLEEQGLIRRDSTKPRALEVLDGSHVRGRSVPHISQRLFISRSTVKTHISHLYEKLGVSDRQEMIDVIESISLSQGE